MRHRRGGRGSGESPRQLESTRDPRELVTHPIQAEEHTGLPLVVAKVWRNAELSQGSAIEPTEGALWGNNSIRTVDVSLSLIGWIQSWGGGKKGVLVITDSTREQQGPLERLGDGANRSFQETAAKTENWHQQ